MSRGYRIGLAAAGLALLLACIGVALQRTLLPTERDLGIVRTVPVRDAGIAALDPDGTRGISAAALNADGTLVAIADYSGGVTVVGVGDGHQQYNFPPPPAPSLPASPAPSPGGEWNPPGRGAQVAFSADGRYLAHASRLGLHLWRLDRGEPLALAGTPDEPFGAVIFLPDGRLQAYATRGAIYRWPQFDDVPIEYAAAPQSMIETWAFGEQGQSFLACRTMPIDRAIDNLQISILAIETGQTRLITVLEGGFCADLGLSPDGQTLVVKTPSEEYLLIAPGDGRVRSTIRLDDANGGGGIAFDPAGKWVVLGGRDMLSFRQLADGRVVGTLHALPPLAFDLPVHFWSVTLSRDGRFVAAVCSDFSVRVWHR